MRRPSGAGIASLELIVYILGRICTIFAPNPASRGIYVTKIAPAFLYVKHEQGGANPPAAECALVRNRCPTDIAGTRRPMPRQPSPIRHRIEAPAEAPMSITGGCLCGKVRYSVDTDPILTRICWCRDCQHLAAGGGTVNVVFPAEAVAITGPLRGYESVADSGNRMRRQFCETCGTPVTSGSHARPHLIILRAGTLDDPEIVNPSMAIWTASAPSWACIDPDMASTPRQPPPAT